MYQNIYIENTEDKQTIVHLWDDETGYAAFDYSPFHYAYQTSPNGDRTSLYGNPVKKVMRWADHDPTVFEADLPRETRVLTDLYEASDAPSTGHRVVFGDIEVSMENGVPNIEKAANPITSIAILSRTTGKYLLFIVDPKHEVRVDEIAADVGQYETEEEMLLGFLTWYAEEKPTIFSGWNSDYFDVPYLYRRLCVVFSDEAGAQLSPVGKIKWSGLRQKFLLAGVACLDYMNLYKKFTYTQRPNYRLDSIGELECGIRKVHFEGSLDELYRTDITKFAQYNVRDVEILDKLDRKLKLIELVRGICHVGHVPYEDFAYSSRFLEGTMLIYMHRKGIVAPSKPKDGQAMMAELDDSGEQGFEGAYVKEPKPGRYEWVFSLDLQSLYPSIIMSLNISPETKVGFVKNWNAEAHVRKQLPEYDVANLDGSITKLTREDFMEFMDEGKFTLSSNGVLYRTDKTGIIPEVLDRWFAERLEFKKKMKDALAAGNEDEADYFDRRQHIQKIFLNSLYGVLGLPIFRFYDLDNALAVTASGQDVIRTSAKYVNAQYNSQLNSTDDYNIYIDTDSLYFSSLPLAPTEFDPKEFTVQCARRFETALNGAFYPTMSQRLFFCSKHRFVIKGEVVADAGFWVTKKRYALHKVYDLDTNTTVDKMTVKGLDVVRSSFPTAFRGFMSELLKDILAGKPKEHVDERILTFHSQIKQLPIEDVARNTACKEISKWETKNAPLTEFPSGAPAHIKAALVYNRLLKHFKVQNRHEPISDGGKIKWTYLKDNPLHLESVAFKTYDDPKVVMDFIRQYADVEELFDREFKGKLEDFYAALGWGRIVTEVNQLAAEFFG